MKCVIPGPNVKVFGRAVHSLSKIGDELYIEPLDDSLAVRTVNSSRSAYACFTFKTAFFIHYVPTAAVRNTQGEDEEAVRCKISMKSCLTVFNSLSMLDKTVDKCKIHLDMKEARLVFQLHCKHGIVKTHNLSFIECETLQAVFTKDLMPNCLTAQSRLFMDAVVNFQNNQEEISLSVDPSKVMIKNYVDDEPDPSKCIRSELALDPEEFDNYQIGIDTEVTFCLKELRAILAFTEPTNLPLSAHFEGAGKPIVLSIDGEAGFEGDFVLATLAEANSQASQQSMHARNTTQHISTLRTPRSVNQKRPNVPKERSRTESFNQTSVAERTASKSNGQRNHPSKPSARPSSSTGIKATNSVNAPSSNATSVNHSLSSKSANSNEKLTCQQRCNEEETSPLIPQCSEKPQNKNTLLSAMDDSDETDDEEMLPGTPPAKKFKSLFFGISQSTQGSPKPNNTSDTHKVLAEDTDDDD